MTENKLIITPVGQPEPWLINAATEINIDLAGLTHEVSNYFVNHSINRHGDEKTERDQGQLPISNEDIVLIPEVIKSPDYAVIGISKGMG
ncbi:MAG: hypothetical protein LBB82_02505 [Treponema sp.]|jgi:hypothetical protein|nr:hypothetical protein [Treponema sp.]